MIICIIKILLYLNPSNQNDVHYAKLVIIYIEYLTHSSFVSYLFFYLMVKVYSITLF